MPLVTKETHLTNTAYAANGVEWMNDEWTSKPANDQSSKDVEQWHCSETSGGRMISYNILENDGTI